jgi:hypothetical protein
MEALLRHHSKYGSVKWQVNCQAMAKLNVALLTRKVDLWIGSQGAVEASAAATPVLLS